MRLIDADEIEKFIEDGLNCIDKNKRFGHDAIEIMTEVHYSQTVDAKPVVHGKWIVNTDNFTPAKRCSVCGYNFPMISGECITQNPDNYCSNCGAKMDLEDFDES